MNKSKTNWPLILVIIMLATLTSGFIFDWGKKKPKDPNEVETAPKTLQAEELAGQAEKIAELNRKIEEQNKLIATLEERSAELEGITGKIDKLQAEMAAQKTSASENRIDINESDMSTIQQMIEKQVKLNVAKSQMPRAGVVSIRQIFRDCKKSAKYRQDSNTERQKIDAELTKLDSEIKAQRAALKTLKIGSESFLAQSKEILEKQANLQAQQEFYKQHLALQEQRITEEIYSEILRITGEIAQEKGLAWVFETSEPEIPALTPTELELSMGMHKLLYGGGCEDITGEVLARLDS